MVMGFASKQEAKPIAPFAIRSVIFGPAPILTPPRLISSTIQPEFDQLLSADKAQRVLEMVLKSIEHYTPS
jgi:hypothetical protein